MLSILQSKRWLYKSIDRICAKKFEAEMELSPITAQILAGRGFCTAEEVRAFLHGSEQPFYDPMLLSGLPQAVERIAKAIERREKITVYGDYDVDGMTASSLLLIFFREMGVEIDFYIPVRQSEGYGLNAEAIQKIAAAGTSLLITVDCGISSVDEVAAAPAGLDIIITDHHTPPQVLPKAFAVVNPKQEGCQYPYKELSGVGVAFKLCQGLWSAISKETALYSRHLDIVALGTIADVVPMTGENREIVRKGLAEINEKLNIGIQALAQVADVTDKKISTGHVGFMLAPRLNAAGRLSSARMGVQLLTTDDMSLAQELACQLNDENQQRQKIERKILFEAEQLIAEQGGAKEVILLAGRDWHAGVIGIVASRLVEKHTRPVIMISIGDDVCKASCRSIPALDMYAALDFAKEYLVGYGGHHQAAGFSVLETNIQPLYDRLLAYARMHLSQEDYIPLQRIDVQIDELSDIDEKLLHEFELLEPYGVGNPTPVLAVCDVDVRNICAMGVDGKHLRFVVEKNRKNFSGLFWNKSEFKHVLYDGATSDIAFAPELNEWQGQRKINLKLVDIKQERMLIDFRKESVSAQEECLKAILQESKNVCFYPENFTSHGDVEKAPALEQCESLVFRQPPYMLLDDKLWWQRVKKSSVKKIYLLYNKENVKEELACLDGMLPDVVWLRDIYRFIKETGVVSEDALRAFAVQGKPLATALLVLQEIGAIKKENENYKIVCLDNGIKLRLSCSETYKQIEEQQRTGKNSLIRCMTMESKDFAELCFE